MKGKGNKEGKEKNERWRTGRREDIGEIGFYLMARKVKEKKVCWR